MTEIKIKCKNCSSEFTGQYCNTCGQGIVGRITLKHIWSQVAEDIFNIDKGLIYTIRQLWTNPGKTAADYIEGKRKNYYGPVKYLILWTAIFFIVSPFFMPDDRQNKSIVKLVFNENVPFTPEVLEDFLKIYIELVVRHTDLFYLGMTPFFALSSYYLFKTKQFSIIELLIPYLYLVGQIAFILVIGLPIVKFSGTMGQYLFMAITVVTLIYLVIKLHRQLFHESWTRTVFKSLTVIYGGQIIYGLATYLTLNIIKAIY